MLRWGIPEYRLPREILDREIDDIIKLGPELRLDTRVGQDVSWKEIKDQYEAVYLAIGAQKSMKAGVEGEDLKGIEGAIEFLRDLNLGKSIAIGRRVAVIGGGNSAIDAARSALRLGAEEVTILYRRLRKDMPAQEEEISAAEEEGVKINYLITPIRFQGENGTLKKVICQTMSLGEFDSGGRRKPVPKLGDIFEMEIDQVILAIGQETDYGFEPAEASLEITRRGFVSLSNGFKSHTTAPMVFAGGDIVTGPDTVVGAIAAGHTAAREIDEALRAENGEPAFIPVEEEIEIPAMIDEEVQEMQRACVMEAECSERIKDFREVELGLSDEDVMSEACRCLRCDIKIEA
jgi:NADH-quinone oxidoreductase subunit F